MSETATKPVNGTTKTATDGIESPSGRKAYMTSTWMKDPSKIPFFSTRNFMWFIHYHGPETPREGKLPRWTFLQQSKWVEPWLLAPMVLQYVSMAYFDVKWTPLAAYGVYVTTMIVNLISTALFLHSMCAKYGFLDSTRPRDQMPDIVVTKQAITMFSVPIIRTAVGVWLKYDQNELPNVNLWLPLQVGAYLISLDFFFYVYHRSSHEIDFLWNIHRTHHLTKHPTSIFTIFADEEQDFIEILCIPLLAALVVPGMNFFTWWWALNYLFFSELLGHSGLRMYTSVHNPLGWLLKMFDVELIVEDHDLHHRNGWRKSSNYGKQTRIFDKLFGTTRPRIEATDENVEW